MSLLFLYTARFSQFINRIDQIVSRVIEMRRQPDDLSAGCAYDVFPPQQRSRFRRFSSRMEIMPGLSSADGGPVRCNPFSKAYSYANVLSFYFPVNAVCAGIVY